MAAFNRRQMTDLSDLTLDELLAPEGFDCACGKRHHAGVRRVALSSGAMDQLPSILQSLGVRKPFIVTDGTIRPIAAARVCGLLDKVNVPYGSYCFPQPHVEPDEFSIGQVLLAYDRSCDSVLAVGSGTINDICKILSYKLNLPQIVVATAPSMDGYASNSSALICGGIKSTVYSRCPEAIIADTDILRQAPMRMIQAGLGDIIAKYNSICEWRISNLINDEYYCESVAGLMRKAVRKCAAQAGALASRDAGAVQAVTEGLILSGIAMSFAEVSRPASGLEHYFSHIWEMRALEAHKPYDLHGIQVGVGTLLARKLYDWLSGMEPSENKALSAVASFDMQAWAGQVREIFGGSADEIIKLEQQAGKHDAAKHALRLKRILERWPDILQIIRREMPTYEELSGIIKAANGPASVFEIGITPAEAGQALFASMEIRDKYIGSRLLWDLGLQDEMTERLTKFCENME